MEITCTLEREIIQVNGSKCQRGIWNIRHGQLFQRVCYNMQERNSSIVGKIKWRGVLFICLCVGRLKLDKLKCAYFWCGEGKTEDTELIKNNCEMIVLVIKKMQIKIAMKY